MRNIFSMAALGAAVLLASCGPPIPPPIDCGRPGMPAEGCYELTLTSEPSGAAAFLDGNPIDADGLTPAEQVPGLSGRYTLEVTLEGYRPYMVDLELDGIVMHHAVLVPDTATMGTLDVSADVAGGMLMVDGAAVGVMVDMPMSVMVPAGSHVVTVQLAGYVATTQTAEVARDMTTMVDIAVGRDLTGTWMCDSEVDGRFSADVTMLIAPTNDFIVARGFAAWGIEVTGLTLSSPIPDVTIEGSVAADGTTLMWTTTDPMGSYDATCTR